MIEFTAKIRATYPLTVETPLDVARMARLITWAQSVIRYEYLPEGQEATRRRAWIRESDQVLDELRQRMGI